MTPDSSPLRPLQSLLQAFGLFIVYSCTGRLSCTMINGNYLERIRSWKQHLTGCSSSEFRLFTVHVLPRIESKAQSCALFRHCAAWLGNRKCEALTKLLSICRKPRRDPMHTIEIGESRVTIIPKRMKVVFFFADARMVQRGLMVIWFVPVSVVRIVLFVMIDDDRVWFGYSVHIRFDVTCFKYICFSFALQLLLNKSNISSFPILTAKVRLHQIAKRSWAQRWFSQQLFHDAREPERITGPPPKYFRLTRAAMFNPRPACGLVVGSVRPSKLIIIVHAQYNDSLSLFW